MFSKQYNQIFHESKSFKKLTLFPAVKITPELANELLRLNDNNRPIRNGIVLKYADQMRAGTWQFTGDTIRISNAAKLLDGQHRLLAVVKSGTTQSYNIQTGLEPEAFEVIDTGRARTAADAVSVKGINNATTVAGAVKVIMSLKEKTISAKVESKRNITNTDVIAFLETEVNMSLMIEMASLAKRWWLKSKFFAPSTYAAFAYVFGIDNREESILFFDLLTTGENIGKNNYSPIYLLRGKFLAFFTSNKTLDLIDKYALLIKAWNAYLKGKEIQQLSWSQKEAFPDIAK